MFHHDKGPNGGTGDPGEQGLQGDKGIMGEKGEKGGPGMIGPDGKPGINGTDGAKGTKGEKGYRGAQGQPGLPGMEGEKGESIPGTREYTHASNGQKECTKSKRCRNIKHTCGEVLVLCIVIELVQLVPMGLMDWMGAKVPLDLLVSVETRE